MFVCSWTLGGVPAPSPGHRLAQSRWADSSWRGWRPVGGLPGWARKVPVAAPRSRDGFGVWVGSPPLGWRGVEPGRQARDPWRPPRGMRPGRGLHHHHHRRGRHPATGSRRRAAPFRNRVPSTLRSPSHENPPPLQQTASTASRPQAGRSSAPSHRGAPLQGRLPGSPGGSRHTADQEHPTGAQPIEAGDAGFWPARPVGS